MALGKALRSRREQSGLPQQGLAQAVGVAYPQIQKYERGENRVTVVRLLDLAQTLNCSFQELVDKRITGTIEAIEAGLMEGGFVRRHAAPGLGLEEGTFLPAPAGLPTA